MIPYDVMKDIFTPGYEERQRERSKALAEAWAKAKPANLGPGPAADYGKGPGNWTGD